MTSDFPVLVQTFLDLPHVPPVDLDPIRTILDLGSNIGLTLAHYAVLFPKARIIGVELDPGNALLCSVNIKPYGDRCSLVQGAVWVSDGSITYDGAEEWGFHVSSDQTSGRSVRSFSMTTLLEMFPEQTVDFVKMDVEGAEKELIKSGESWARKVRCVRVEIHPPYSVAECLSDFTALGMHAKREDVLGTTAVTARWPT